MLVLKTEKELKSHLSSLGDGKSLGLVPTMGALHHGHTSLVQRAISENDTTIVSIFINPTQFNNQEDLKKYPQSITKDIHILEKLSGKVIVFAPSVEEMYPQGVTSTAYRFDGLDKVMEGAFREGHFDGVGTVVETLLRLVNPHKAYFGEKDFQQLQIVKRLVQIKDIPVDIIGCPIVREPNGLAMSSRNERLSPALRKEAGIIYKTLETAKRKFGTESAKSIMDWAKNKFKGHPNLELEYIVIADEKTLMPLKGKKDNKKYRAFMAVYAGTVRLIDNIALN
ncbi:pantoate--beta-alanine ligase [Ulvibacterium sp.]|uniref:pantoate--beta-alanine ligase n=1 Tax=Ulvibacterium sp. TaxID=2665914 RepID=UPI00260710D8|nr:pantoate--beta-alanine ligase [Ulvibacterium sp.]